MPRESIEMSLEEVTAFLANQAWVVLATLDADGSPWTDVVPSAVHEGRLLFRVAPRSRSEGNVRRDPRVSCTQDENPSYFGIRGVIVHGVAERISEEDGARALEGRADPLAPEDTDRGETWGIPIDEVVSFDFSRIGGR